MAHHSSDPEMPPAFRDYFKDTTFEQREATRRVRALEEKLAEATKEHQLGATGQFPLGKLVEQDEGELRLAVAHTNDGKVILNFGKPVVWIGFTADQADEIARLLQEHAAAIRKT